MTDPLQSLHRTSACPVCGCLELKGSVRCAECGTFHSGIHLEEREAPQPQFIPERDPIDPSVYSLSDTHSIPDESFEESEEISEWRGGSTDFTMEDVEEPPLSRVDVDELELPSPEELLD